MMTGAVDAAAGPAVDPSVARLTRAAPVLCVCVEQTRQAGGPSVDHAVARLIAQTRPLRVWGGAGGVRLRVHPCVGACV